MNERLELSLRCAREHRDDMARWLALEVLLNDPEALADAVLEEHLYALQDKIEQKLRAAARTIERKKIKYSLDNSPDLSGDTDLEFS